MGIGNWNQRFKALRSLPQSAMDSPALALSPSVTGGRIYSEFPFQGIFAVSPNGFIPHSASKGVESNSLGDVHRRLSKLESLFRYDKEFLRKKLKSLLDYRWLKRRLEAISGAVIVELKALDDFDGLRS